MRLSWKRYRRRKAPAFHKNDAVSYRFYKLYDVPKACWYDKSWKDTTKRRHQYKNIVFM